jgi:hypothetical protein
MSLRKTNLVPGEIYHIYNRGVDKRDIFMEDEDRFRFVHDLFEFNDENPTVNLGLYLKNKYKEVGLPYNFLNTYRWSSYLDYIGQKNFPSVIKKDFLLSRLGNEEKQKEEIIDWIKSFKDNLIKEIILE